MKVASGNVLWRQRKRNWCRTPFTFTVYTLTDKELSVKTGILNENFNLIKLFRIVDISVERTFLQRIFGMSTIVLDTRDQSSGNGVVALKTCSTDSKCARCCRKRWTLPVGRMACRRVNSSAGRAVLLAWEVRDSVRVLTVLASTAVSMVPTWVVTPTVGK